MTHHVVLGAGPIGRSLARHLAEQGDDVLVLSRSGGVLRWLDPPDGLPGRIRTGTVDGTDGDALAAHAEGATTLFNAVNPPYHRWATDWPPVMTGLLTAAERSGAVLVTAGNLYQYGRATTPMTERSPETSTERKGRVRAEMWDLARRRHDAGRVRATEVRGSDYLGPEAEDHAHGGPRLLRPLLRGRTLRPIGRADVPHTWTYLPDFAAALAAAGRTEAAWGRAWHVPSPEPLTVRQLAERFAAAAGVELPAIRPVPIAAVRAIGLVQPQMRELAAVGHQHAEPYVMDSAESQAVLGVSPTPWDRVVAETLAAFDPAAPAVSRF